MNTLFGANWRTTLTGWITVLASALVIKPDLIAFLPDPVRTYVLGFAGIVAVVSGGTFAVQSKDRNVTGGTIPNDVPKPSALPLVLFALLPVFALSGCAWVNAHQSQISATGGIVGDRAAVIAEPVLVGMAVNAADKNHKADFLDSVATGLRQNEASIVNSDDVSRIVKIWSPNDGAHWQQLAGNLGALTGQALQAQGHGQTAAIVENIAVGLNTAAADARKSTTP